MTPINKSNVAGGKKKRKKARNLDANDEPLTDMMFQALLNEKTQKFIKKLKLKPSKNESLYSQSFIDRERSLIRRVKEKSQQKIMD